MRKTHGAIFLAFALVGFTSVFNGHSPALTASPDTNLAAPTQPTGDTPQTDDITTVQTELVKPQVVRTDEPAVVLHEAREARRSLQRGRTKPRLSRSLLARVVLGNGQFRPQPFPTPATGLK